MRIVIYRSGTVEIKGEFNGGSVCFKLTDVIEKAPSGVFHFTNDEIDEFGVICNDALNKLTQFVEKVNKRVASGE